MFKCVKSKSCVLQNLYFKLRCRLTKYDKYFRLIPILQPTKFTCYLKFFILVKRSTCFGQSCLPSSGAQKCVYSNGIWQTAAASGDKMALQNSSISSPLAAGSSSCLTYTVVVYAFLSSWWWTERPSETCRAFYKNKEFEITGASCWLYYRNILRCTDLWILKLLRM